MNHQLLERPRRLRKSESIRDMVRETWVGQHDLIRPLFIVPGKNINKAIGSLPGQSHLSVDQALIKAQSLFDQGIRSVLLFGLPEHKDATGSESFAKDGVLQQAITAIKHNIPKLCVITDVCLCAYTDHGHCGPLVQEGGHTSVDNDATLDLIAKVALSHAKAGADIVAPSGMMDGMIGAIRHTLDQSGYHHTAIISYAVKYASHFYGPFRDAAHSSPSEGDRKSYQMDPANWREALKEARLDIEQGADMLMVKPAMAYLDIVRLLKDNFDVPIVAYSVSGEHAMMHAAAEKGWLDLEGAQQELLTCIKRAGADMIIQYG